MKILVLGTKEYPFGTGSIKEDPLPSGGIELYVDNLVRHIGHHVIVLTRKFRNQPARETINNVEVRRTPFIPGFYLRNPTFNLMSFCKALALDFDIIVAHDDIAGLMAILLSKIKRKPAVIVCHGLPSEQPQYNRIIRLLFKMVERVIYLKSDANITHSPQQLLRITKRFHVIYPGIDNNRIRKASRKQADLLRKKYRIGKKKVILYVGRLVKVKGVECLIKSLDYVKAPYSCFIVGDGPDAGQYKNVANSNIIFTGHVDNVSDYLSIANVFVLPSYSESLNYSMLEAASLGVPIVVTDLGIIPENSAIIVKKGDFMAIGNGINAVFNDRKKSLLMIRMAKRFTKKFSWKNAAKEYRRILEDLE